MYFKVGLRVNALVRTTLLHGTSRYLFSSSHLGTLSTSEAKKLRNKQRKAARKAEAEAARVRAEQERREQAARSRQAGSEDNDPDRPAPADSGLDPNTLARVSRELLFIITYLRRRFLSTNFAVNYVVTHSPLLPPTLFYTKVSQSI